MKKTIAEDLPARKHPAGAAVQGGDDKGGDHKEKGAKSPEERVRQAVYDIRYRARREELPLQQAYSQYMQNSNMSQQEKTLVKGKLFGKGGMKAEEFNIEDFASSTVANALYKVFVEGVGTEEPIRLTYMEKMETSEDRKYKVKVTGKDGRSYVRYATREKISQLRANDNIQSVEMTEHGEPYEGERKRGERTAAVKAGKDYDGDGKVESGAKEHAGAVHNAIQRKKGGVPDGKDTSNVREGFIGEVNGVEVDPTTGETIEPPIDVMKGKNIVKISPDVPGTGRNQTQSLQMSHYDMEGPFIAEKAVSQAQQKFMGMVYAAKKGKKAASPEVAKAAAGMSKKEARKFAKTKHKGLPVHKEETECNKDSDKKEIDPRQLKTMKDRTRTSLGLMGIKASYEPEGEVIDELRRSEKMGMGSPEERTKSGHLIGARGERKRLGQMGGRRWTSGGEGGSKLERGKKKNEPGSQHSRLNAPTYPQKERAGKYSAKLRQKRGYDIPSN